MSEYLISLLLVVLVSVFTVYPLFLGRWRQGTTGIPEISRLKQLYERRDIYYSSIRDIELDRDMGKLNEQDYAELVSRYKEKAATVSKQISEFKLMSTSKNMEKERE